MDSRRGARAASEAAREVATDTYTRHEDREPGGSRICAVEGVVVEGDERDGRARAPPQDAAPEVAMSPETPTSGSAEVQEAAAATGERPGSIFDATGHPEVHIRVQFADL